MGIYPVEYTILGALYGPFGFLFWRIFPDRKKNDEIPTRILHQCDWGRLCCMV